MRWLKQELQLQEGDEVTLMSDMQKGLMEAVKEVCPYAEHRWCARHIYSNWSKKWRGQEMKKRFWLAAWSTYEEEFKLNIAKLRSINPKAADDLLHYPPANWSRAYQTTRCSTHMVDNNCSESFNSNIVDARHKPIVSMLEDIRLMCMKRVTDRKFAMLTWKGEWAPNAVRFFEQNKSDSIECHVVWNGEYGYEVSEGEDRHNVFLDTKKCTCRVWELTGVPCCHVIAAFYYSNLDPMTAISKCYHKELYAKAYCHVIHPVPGVKFWNVRAEDEVEPPPVEIKVGRPKKNRVRAKHEPRHQHKLSRKGKLQHCSLCRSDSHKKDACPENPAKADKSSQASCSSKPKKRAPSGIGLHVNLETGKQTLHSGSQSVIIDEGTPRDQDPNVRFAIPSERELRLEKRKRASGKSTGESSKVKKTSTKAFKAPRGKAEADQVPPILRRSPRGKKVDSTIGSTTTS